MRRQFNQALAITLMALSLASLPTWAQTNQGQARGKAKAGQETNCDGALEIVPQKQMTFARKRRPKAAPEQAPRPDAKDAKPAKEPAAAKEKSVE